MQFLNFLFWLASAAKHPLTELECNDQEIHDQCVTECRMEYLDCLAGCETSYCTSECLEAFSECDKECPCGINCPTGCQDCAHHLCEQKCENAQIENNDYKVCINEIVFEMDLCLKECSPTFACHDQCLQDYQEALPYCPCFEQETSTSTAVSTTSSLSTTTSSPPITPSGTNILVILSDLSKSYLTNGDGSEILAAKISAPSDDYANRALSAVVQGKLYLFGGIKIDKKKIARLDVCTFVELPYKLNFDGHDGHAALSISNNSEALICVDRTNWRSCDVFNGSSVVSTYSMLYTHRYGGLGFYNGQPITVGSFFSDGYRKVETLSSNGWTSLADTPMTRNHGHNLVGLPNNDLLVVAGYENSALSTKVWRLSNNSWSLDGNMKQKVGYGSAILNLRSIYIFAGMAESNSYPNQRLDLHENDEIAGFKQIGDHDGVYYWPALFVTSQDYCVLDK